MKSQTPLKKIRKWSPLQEYLRKKVKEIAGVIQSGPPKKPTQLLAGVKLKKGVLNKRMTEMIQTQANGKDILAIGKPLEKILPMFNRMDSITPLIVKGENVDFLSDGDLGKIEYREQNLLDALIDSLSYLNSLYDQVLLESDKKLMGVPQSE